MAGCDDSERSRFSQPSENPHILSFLRNAGDNRISIYNFPLKVYLRLSFTQAFTLHNIQFECITGSIPLKKRTAAINRWKTKPDIPVLLFSTVMATGMNLCQGRIVIHLVRRFQNADWYIDMYICRMCLGLVFSNNKLTDGRGGTASWRRSWCITWWR